MSFAKNVEKNYFVELLLAAASEPRMILILIITDAVVPHFLKNSSSVFFKGFQVVSYLSLHFYNSGLAVFWKHPSLAAFVPLLLFFRKPHSVVIDFHNPDLFKLLARTAAINFPDPLFQ